MAATLVLSAWEPEIAPLRRLVRAVARERVALATVGVGAIDAALASCGAAKSPVPLLGVACPIAVTRSATLGRHLAHATGAALENLEAFAVARAAAAAGVDEVTAVLGIANRVGPRGHQEWRAHHAAASRAACRLVGSSARR